MLVMFALFVCTHAGNLEADGPSEQFRVNGSSTQVTLATAEFQVGFFLNATTNSSTGFVRRDGATVSLSRDDKRTEIRGVVRTSAGVTVVGAARGAEVTRGFAHLLDDYTVWLSQGLNTSVAESVTYTAVDRILWVVGSLEEKLYAARYRAGDGRRVTLFNLTEWGESVPHSSLLDSEGSLMGNDVAVCGQVGREGRLSPVVGMLSNTGRTIWSQQIAVGQQGTFCSLSGAGDRLWVAGYTADDVNMPSNAQVLVRAFEWSSRGTLIPLAPLAIAGTAKAVAGLGSFAVLATDTCVFRLSSEGSLSSPALLLLPGTTTASLQVFDPARVILATNIAMSGSLQRFWVDGRAEQPRVVGGGEVVQGNILVAQQSSLEVQAPTVVNGTCFVAGNLTLASASATLTCVEISGQFSSFTVLGEPLCREYRESYAAVSGGVLISAIISNDECDVLSPGIIAGIVAGCIAVVALALALPLFLVERKSSRSDDAAIQRLHKAS